MNTGQPLRKFRVTITAHVPDLEGFRVEGVGFYRNARDFECVQVGDTEADALALALGRFSLAYPTFRLEGTYGVREEKP